MFNKLKQYWVWFVMVLVAGGIVVNMPFGADKIPVDLQLKVDKEKVIHSVEQNWIVEGEDRVPIDKGRITRYYFLEIDDEQELYKRTARSKHRLVGDKVVADIYGSREFYKNADGWNIIMHATTTPEAFEKEMKLTLLDKAKRLAGVQVLADDFYPDPNPETTTVDGTVFEDANSDWDTIHDSSNGTPADDGTPYWDVYVDGTGTNNVFDWLNRGIFLFDISSIAAGQTITAVTFATCANAKQDNNNRDICIVSSSPASNTGLVIADYTYTNFGTTKYATKNITSINTGLTNYSSYTLNAAGIAFVQTAYDGDSIVKLGVRMECDIDDNCSWSSTPDGTQGIHSEQDDITSDPKLTVTYEAASSGATPKPLRRKPVIIR